MKVAVVPARGGSKRIPRKNIRSFLGRPMIAYSIEAAIATGVFDRILVSTDDDEIAGVAAAAGAEAPFRRPATLSDDRTGTGAVMAHALDWLAQQGAPADFACCIYATAPFVRPGDIASGLEALQAAPEKAYAFSAASFPFPIQRAIRRSGAMFQPEHAQTRSQDLEEAFHDAAQFYWGRAAAWTAATPIFAETSIPIVLPRWRVQDIDTEEDWRRAELMHQALDAADDE